MTKRKKSIREGIKKVEVFAFRSGPRSGKNKVIF